MKPLHAALALALVCALAAGAGYFAWQKLASSKLTGTPAPDIVLTDLDGKPHHLSQWLGHLVLVNFWATWCSPCMDELPLLVEAQKHYGSQGLQIIGPAMDEADAVRASVARFGVSYPVMADFSQTDAAMAALGDAQGALPYSVLVSADGRIIKTILGGLHKGELEAMIESNLAH